MTENKNLLNIKNKQALTLLKRWFDNVNQNGKQYVSLNFLIDAPIGHGAAKYDIDKNFYEIEIGIAPLSTSLFAKHQTVNDLDFIKTGITMFHELAHYERSTSDDTPKEILISDLSKYQNKHYYLQNWAKLPHEIDAEYTGVMTMWEHLEIEFPETAESLMLEYLTVRAGTTNYMINVPENGFQSREQVETLFETAYAKALDEKQNLPKDFLRSDDEIAKVFTTDEYVIRADHYPFYNQLMTAKTGQELTLKMASLVSYFHPELERAYPKLDFKELKPSVVFGTPMPETIEATEFTEAIDKITEKSDLKI